MTGAIYTNMFLKGDKIVCIDDKKNHYLEYESEVSLGEEYICSYSFSSKEGHFVRFLDDNGLDKCLLAYKFISADDPQNAKNIKYLKRNLLQNKLKVLLSI